MALTNLYQLLEQAALNSSENGLTIYQPGDADHIGQRLTYRGLLQAARSNSRLLPQIQGISSDSVVLLHFNNHYDGIEWFWSVVTAGYLPAISTPFTNDIKQRERHIQHLQKTLNDPVIITTKSLLTEFAGVDGLNIYTIEDLRSRYDTSDRTVPSGGSCKKEDALAVLMLTSGSTGNAKAVSLRHGQILKAIQGKSEFHGTEHSDIFMNWIGLDHVANLTEIHLHAMLLAAEQVHVQAADLLTQPLVFLELVHKHRVAYTFAPNFFLAALKQAVEDPKASHLLTKLKFSCLKSLISGGEATVVETCKVLNQLMIEYGARKDLIRPGFGMTETCAGSIYSKACPSYDITNNLEFACLGTCIPGLSMRITAEDGTAVGLNEAGNLQLSGPVVFKDYYNNPTATAEAFTSDGWFITGDKALIDSSGRLNLAGRAKESIIINGVKYYPQALETALAEAEIDGITPSYTVVFPHRPKKSPTEVLCVVYLPAYNPDDVAARVRTIDAISKAALLQMGVRPYKIIPLDASLLPKSSLGKLSRVKIRTAFENGVYHSFEKSNEEAIRAYRFANLEQPQNATEETIRDCFVDIFDTPKHEIGVNSSLLEMGASSIEMIKLKKQIEDSLNLDLELPIIEVMTNPTIRGLALAVKKIQEPIVYNPVVVLQSQGTKTPLWLVHPGVGEVLVFLNLAKYIIDRPVYALRARGFEGEDFHKSIPDVISTYHSAMKALQPTGPYAIAGYSYGAMIAFEITKTLESAGDEVKFLGSFNLPPHIKFRMRQLDWVECVLNLSYFLDLFDEDYAHAISPAMHLLSQDQVLDHIIAHAAPSRMDEMGLDRHKLSNWANLAFNMQSIASHYDPSGTVQRMDVFVAIPLQAVAKSKQEWLDTHLRRWGEFVREDVRFHDVDGAHYTMIGPENVLSFWKKLRGVLTERGL